MKIFTFTFLLLLITLGVSATQNKKTVTLRLQSIVGVSDATIYFDNGISPVYSVEEDAQMIFDSVPGVPEIYSYTLDKVPCSINGAGTLSSASVVSLGYKVKVNGLYIISAATLDNFNSTSIIRLQDTKLDTIIDLRENFYQVQLDTSDTTSGRFNLLVSTPVQFSSHPSNCSNNGGMISLTPDSSIIWTVCSLVADTTNQVIAVDSNVNGTINFTNLPAGSYSLQFTYNRYVTTQNFYVAGNYIIASIGVPPSPIYTLEDVVFNGISTNANQYSWSFGDGTLIDGVANPTQIYYVPGTYTVTFNCSNDSGCAATVQATVVVLLATGINNVNAKNISITSYNNNITVNMNTAPDNGAVMQVFNLLGQSIYAEPITMQNEVVNLEGQMPGYYIVSVTDAGKTETKRIFLPK